MNATVKNVRSTSAYAEEALVVDLQSLLHTVMVEHGMTRSQLAQSMGVSKARITQLFSADCSNFTVRLLARALHALGERLEVSCHTYRQVQRRLRMTEVLETAGFCAAEAAFRWEMPANDQSRFEVAKASPGETRTSGLIARSLLRTTTEHRRAA